MATEFSFNFPLPAGLHARPASAFAEAAKPFASDITFINDRTGTCADVKSVLALIGTGALPGDPCRLVIEGTDEPRAREALSRFVTENLPHADDPQPDSANAIGEIDLPHCLRNSGATLFKAKSAVQGIGIGRLVRLADEAVAEMGQTETIVESTVERDRLLAAMQALDASYAERIKNTSDKLASGLIQAHRAMARDVALRDWLLNAVTKRNLTAIQAVTAGSAHFAGLFSASASVSLRERALDVRDVCRQLARPLSGPLSAPPAELTEDSILIAEEP